MVIPENLQFQYDFEVGSFQVHPDGKISLTSLADLLQEIAWRHADSADFGRNLMDTHQMWVLSRLEVKVNKFPTWGESIRLFTGGRGADKLFAFREFLVWDRNDQLLARGMSSWLLLNSETKRIQRPEQVLPPALFDPKMKPAWQPGKIVTGGELIAEEEIKVRLSDLDLYNHVNNTSYVRWVENLLFDQGIRPENIAINYVAECIQGDKVVLKLFEKESKFTIEGKVNEKIVFLAEV
ncbi:acyl-[acyl-carrier-protein] thioesterase [Algoriphagus sp.]|uniref:acyl-[acyl-carrier-protein] thioesterase n=1 Tax=Algoriphagus sp. TaxID=1872435 RepID=UPI00272704E4|nr:acyl-ACP thioesterase domain-containing protein [Algoriphagus sp.]MDO8966755.1 thioesterase [Algoriphagus sp.]MDP3199922.1 thioesterase [Algoriphagus sp.]